MATGPRKQKTPEGAVGRKDKAGRNLTPVVVYTMAEIMKNPSGVRSRSAQDKHKGTHSGGGTAPGNQAKRTSRKQHRAKNPRQPARKRQELDMTAFQDQPGQYGSASSRDRIRAEIEAWRYAGSTEARTKLRTLWGLGPAAAEWLDAPATWPTDYRGYLRARSQDALQAVYAGRRVFQDTTARPKASKILGVWQDRLAPVPAPAQKPVPKPAPPRQVPAQPAQTPAPKPAVPVMRVAPVLTHRIPKHERGPVALALEKALRESGLTLEQKMEKVEIYRVRHGIRVAILD